MAQPPSVDGVTPSAPQPGTSSVVQQSVIAPVQAGVEGTKRLLIVVVVICYVAYILWCVMLISLLPSPNGGMTNFIQIGSVTAFIGAAGFLLFGIVGLFRIRSNAALPVSAKQRAFTRILITAIPGLLLSLAVPFLINREPALAMDIIKPTSLQDMVAPVEITFSVEHAVDILRSRGLVPLTYKWDVNGDGKVDQQTVTPVLTTTYDQQGNYTTAVSIGFADATQSPRTIVRSLNIIQAVFTVDPPNPVVNQPAVFDVSNLIKDSSSIDSIDWDLDNDGKADVSGKDTRITTTFFRTGDMPIAVTIHLTNKTQMQYQRSVTVVQPAPLPFPISIVTDPKKLLGPTDFSVVFTLDTKEPLSDVQWSFGDGSPGDTGTRTVHTFQQTGTFIVDAKARSASGAVADVTATVKIVDSLTLPDLSFDKGSPDTPDVQGSQITGEIPITIKLQPKTTAQFITFSWEAPDATEDRTLDSQLDVTYRKAGTYDLILTAEDAQQHVMIKKMKVIAQPVSSYVSFLMQPVDGVAPLTVNFDASDTNIPNETISGFEWDFGDSSQRQFGSATTQHKFKDPGTYTVTLTAHTTAGNQSSTTQTIVVRAPILQACVLASRTSVAIGGYAKFDSSCTTGTVAKYEWDFGDGGQSEEASPLYQFQKAGSYTVTLTITDASGTTSSKSVTMVVK